MLTQRSLRLWGERVSGLITCYPIRGEVKTFACKLPIESKQPEQPSKVPSLAGSPELVFYSREVDRDFYHRRAAIIGGNP